MKKFKVKTVLALSFLSVFTQTSMAGISASGSDCGDCGQSPSGITFGAAKMAYESGRAPTQAELLGSWKQVSSTIPPGYSADLSEYNPSGMKYPDGTLKRLIFKYDSTRFVRSLVVQNTFRQEPKNLEWLEVKGSEQNNSICFMEDDSSYDGSGTDVFEPIFNCRVFEGSKKLICEVVESANDGLTANSFLSYEGYVKQ